MSLAAAVFFAATASPAAPVTLNLEAPHKGVDFSIFRPSTTAPGYRLTSAVLFQLAGGKKAARLTYSNSESRNQFDLIQTPAEGGSSQTHLKGILDKKQMELELLPDSTFVTLRRGKVDVGFLGTLVSGPSALQVLKTVEPWR